MFDYEALNQLLIICLGVTGFMFACFLGAVLTPKKREMNSDNSIARESTEINPKAATFIALTFIGLMGVVLLVKEIEVYNLKYTKYIDNGFEGIEIETADANAIKAYRGVLAKLKDELPQDMEGIIGNAVSKRKMTIKNGRLLNLINTITRDNKITNAELKGFQDANMYRTRSSLSRYKREIRRIERSMYKPKQENKPVRLDRTTKLSSQAPPRTTEKNVVPRFDKPMRRRVLYAYRAVGKNYIVFDPKPGVMPGEDEIYLKQLFHWVDIAAAQRAYTVYWLYSKGNSGESFTKYQTNISSTLHAINQLKPPEDLAIYQGRIIEAIKIEEHFFALWNRHIEAGTEFEYNLYNGKPKHKLAQKNFNILFQMYKDFVKLYPKMSARDRKSIYNRLCALSLY